MLKSWDIFLIGFFLSLLGSIPYLSNDIFIKGILQIIWFLLLFISLGFSFSLPVFLVEKQQGRSLSIANILSITLGNTKRLIIPLMLMGICFIVIGILGIFLIPGGNVNLMQNTPNQGFGLWNIMLMLSIGLFSFFSFANIYFSLEKKSFYSSIKKSISFSFKNLNFVIFLFVISASTYLLQMLFLNNYQDHFQLFIRNFIYQSESLLIAAASLIFYQTHGGAGVTSSSK